MLEQNSSNAIHKVSVEEQRMISEVYGERFAKERNPKSGEELKKSAIEKFKLLSERGL